MTKHESSSAHKEAAEKYRAHQSTSVAVHLSQAYADEQRRRQEEKQQNRAALAVIIDIVRFLARQNISFRGHKETDSLNRGNFLELVHFTAKYNPVLKRWIDCHPTQSNMLERTTVYSLLGT
jgi:hypothetical protein